MCIIRSTKSIIATKKWSKKKEQVIINSYNYLSWYTKEQKMNKVKTVIKRTLKKIMVEKLKLIQN